ncbi:MAG: hypothetical protein HON76_12690 [Candidatus Scalindua sp.]|jgi:hypothetical protein|nr:hypothetical protein [Candidatus Scalindua sp.]MBT5307401.1 hypothetical protein [Candidatus Scalindua sp.]MBT6225280.1 hypothetical protein [Candidatus Scalindua sp.]MBT6563370.1 hypothetical protein [Candidatus Scalindua sp.]MBT7211868.1 hypothetical protein [Candidatus Scalindua sp.]
MTKEIKSGKRILDEFFKDIKTDESLDRDTVAAIVNLYESGKLTDRNLTSTLSELREGKDNG